MSLYELDNKQPQLPKNGSAWVSDSADLIGEVQLQDEVNIWFGATIRADNTPIIIGKRTNIQENSILHSDPGIPLNIGEDCTIGHGAIIHGCQIEDRVLIGMGAIILNGAKIGKDSLVGAGALVTEGKEFPPRSLIVGSPAKAVKSLDDDMVKMLKMSAETYAEKGKHYSINLKKIS